MVTPPPPVTFEAVDQIKNKLMIRVSGHPGYSNHEDFLIWPTASKVTGGGASHHILLFCKSVCTLLQNKTGGGMGRPSPPIRFEGRN